MVVKGHTTVIGSRADDKGVLTFSLDQEIAFTVPIGGGGPAK